jgi:regulator of sirC expression with transglutaminase-like and TPR domain
MSDALSLTLFAHVAARPDDELDLGEAALLLAEIDHPDIDLARARALLDELGEGARAAITRVEIEAGGTVRAGEREELRVDAAVSWLYEEAGFHGNHEDYYDPKNSFLDEVLARRTGIPITLAVVLLEVGRRAGLTLAGVSFPGHFLVRAESSNGPLFIDPFNGQLLGRAELRALHARATGSESDPPPHLLAPADKRTILARMLHNLRGIYAARADLDHLRPVLERLQILAPSPELRAELDRIGGHAPFRSAGRSLN